MRQESAQAARDWAATQDSNSTPTAKGKSSRAPSHSTSAPTASTSTPDAYKSTGTYKGFNIPPPKSYNSNENKGRVHPKSNSLIIATTPRSLSNSSPKPYSRPPPPSNRSTAPLTPGSTSNSKVKTYSTPAPAPLRPTALPLSSLQNAYPTLSTPSRATQSPFKPPTFNRPSPVAGGALKLGLGSNVARGALQKKSLDLDWKKFGGAAEG